MDSATILALIDELSLIDERAALIEALRLALPILEVAAEQEIAWNVAKHTQHVTSQHAHDVVRRVLSKSEH